MRTFLVVGLGRFGTAVATELCTLGNEVLAMDIREERVQAIASQVTHAVTADARDPEVLRTLAVRNFECAVVAVASDVGTSALIALNLKEMGMNRVICKAQSHTHRRVLEKIGADRVVFPEHEMGGKLARSLSSSNILNFIELSDDDRIVEIPAPRVWEGHSLRELDVRNTLGVNIIALRTGKGGKLMIAPGADAVIEPGTMVVALGKDKNVNGLQKL